MKTKTQIDKKQRRLQNYFSTVGLFIGLLLCITFTACEDFLEVEVPEAQLPSDEVYQNIETAEAALAGIYTKLRSETMLVGNSSGLHVLMGLYADELQYYGTPGTGLDAFQKHNIVPSLETVSTLWNSSYSIIYETNALLEGVSRSSALTEEEKDKLIGEALFIRGLTHFYLTNLFGAVPYIKTTDYIQNSEVSRLSQEEVIMEVKNDLIEAKSLLIETYLEGERIHPNKWAASAFLARVYLYNEDWAEAEAESSQVIGQTGIYVWEDNLNDVFVKESTAAIWQFKPAEEGSNTSEGSSFILVSAPPINVALNPGLVEAMENNDLRKTAWIGEVSDEQNTWYFPYKYKYRKNTGTSMEYAVILRLAEQYLIRAEARAQLSDYEGARQDINRIRLRAGLEETTANTQEELLKVIANERRFEFFTEYGHRWFDIKRTGEAAEVLEPIKPGWRPANILLPVPESELLINPNLRPQNPGY